MVPTVIVVDDNPINLKLIAFVLRDVGYAVRTAIDAKSLWSELENGLPQLILLDLQLPDVDGFEIARRLKADEKTRHVPIVAVTAYAMKGDEDRAKAAGCDGYISKPIDTRLLPQQLAKYVTNQ